MVYTAGGPLGSFSLPYAQHVASPIQIRQLQKAANFPQCSRSDLKTCSSFSLSLFGYFYCFMKRIEICKFASISWTPERWE